MSGFVDAAASIRAFRHGLYHDLFSAQGAWAAVFAADAVIQLCYPLDTSEGWQRFWSNDLEPLALAFPDGESLDQFVIAGSDSDSATWIECAGLRLGRLAAPFLGIPPTGMFAHLWYHAFLRVADGQVEDVQAIWYPPDLVRQAGDWLLSPFLGRGWCVLGPAPLNGLGPHGCGGPVACAHVVAMPAAMVRHPRESGPEITKLDRFWHMEMMWFGPSGTGTARGIESVRYSQIALLRAMLVFGGYQHLVTMRSLVFWRSENGLIRENWMLVDLLGIYDQIGPDVPGRMRELPGAMGSDKGERR